ncbi:hypothetical protein ACHQM5_014430 [Ranunculus cassubicifolius]
MGTRRIKAVRILQHSEGFTAGLSSAFREWLLIFLLFVNAVYSYLVTKFARLCKLKVPCILCSRLDHVLGDEKPGFYRDLVCSAHKLEISSLVYCHIHDKLADVHGMCEGCLFSFATEKKSNSETYRLLLAKLGTDHDFCVDKNSLLKNSMLDSSSERHCSCCNELWKAKPFTNRLFPKKSIGSEVATFGLPLSGSLGHGGLKLLDGLKKRRAYMGKRGFDPLSHVGYSELKITSDSESEVPFSDDEDAGAIMRENNLKEESVAQSVQPETSTMVSHTSVGASHEDSTANKLVDQAPTPVHLPLDPKQQHDAGETHQMTSSASDIAVEQDLEELKWHECEEMPRAPALLDLISLHDEPSTSNNEDVLVEVSKGNVDVMGIGDLVETSKYERVLRPETDLTPEIVQRSEKDQNVEVSVTTFKVLQTVDVGQRSSDSSETCQSDSVLTTVTGPALVRDQVLKTPGPLLFNLMGLGDAYKLAVETKGVPASSMFSEQTVKDSAKLNEDLKLLISQASTSRGSGSDLSGNDSPRVRGLHEELKIPDGSSSIGLDTLQKRISVERNDSVYESLDGSIVSEIEGESEIDGMKRQIEYDRKCLSALYKELDEERNASAVAANQAMAMITRLQEEKAALHMEALQYLRMMEEQAEYDVEALQKANDLLAEREKEIQDLESDLDYFRIKYPEEMMEDDIPDSYDYKAANMRENDLDSSCSNNNANGAEDPVSINKYDASNKHERKVHGGNNMSTIKGSLLNLEDERLYISNCLHKMEKKLKACSDNGASSDMCNGVCSGKEDGSSDIEEDHYEVVIHGRNQMEDNSSTAQKGLHLSRDGSPTQDRSSPAEEPHSIREGNQHFDGSDASITDRTNDLVSVESEMLDLNERLETLEADRDFLEHTVNTLQSGEEGVKFVQEIAHHLSELRRIGIRKREKDVA